MAPEQSATPVLPASVVGMLDVGRLIRELEKIENIMQSDELRTGAEAAQMPKLSPLLEQLATENKLDLSVHHQRQSALEFVKLIRKDAPKIHISFSANPSGQFIQKLIVWLRQNLHPHVLVAVGLQPGIGAGCVLRTTNKYFDMSLSRSFAGSRDLLMKRLRESADEQAPLSEPVAPPTEQVPPAEVAA
ncbi:hypothetical protein KDA14_00415 [Candidatus Saccharibacteria bacterium]|nr:hypothetical protein [Candidatus Saccharibacteria bacterium]